MDGIHKPKAYYFVEVEFIPGKGGQELQGQKQFRPHDLVGRGLILDLLKIDPEQIRLVQSATVNKKWNQIVSQRNKYRFHILVDFGLIGIEFHQYLALKTVF